MPIRAFIVFALAAQGCHGCQREPRSEPEAPSPLFPPVTKATQLADGQAVHSTAIDATHVYWGGDDGLVRRVPKGGGAVEDVVKLGGGAVRAVAVQGGTLYVAQMGGASTPDLAAGRMDDVIAGRVGSLAVGDGRGGSGGIIALALGGSEPKRLAAAPWPVALAVDQTHVYWSDASSRDISRVPIEGGPSQKLASGSEAFGLVVDATHVYWGARERGAFFVPKEGGTPKALIRGFGRIGYGFAVDATHVYWGDDQIGMILRAPKNGGPVEFVASGFGIGDRLAVSGDSLFHTSFDWVDLVSPSSGQRTRLSNTFSSAFGKNAIFPVADERHLFLGIQAIRFQQPFVDTTQGETIEVEHLGAIVRMPRQVEGAQVQAGSPHAVRSPVWFKKRSDAFQDPSNATRWIGELPPALSLSVSSGDLDVVLLARTSDQVPEYLALKRGEATASAIREKMSAAKTRVELGPFPELRSGHVLVALDGAKAAQFFGPAGSKSPRPM